MQSVKSKNGRFDDVSTRNGKAIKLLDKIYRPTDKEPFMNERQREYFRVKLLDWREDILKEAKETLQHLQDDNTNHPDLADRASSETDRAIELRARDRQRKLISKIRRRAGAHPRGQHLRLLRGDRRTDFAQAPGSAPDRHALDRGPGTPRTPRAGLPRGIGGARGADAFVARVACPYYRRAPATSLKRSGRCLAVNPPASFDTPSPIAWV